MREIYIILFAAFLSTTAIGQTCPTNGQIYDYAVGDTFEIYGSGQGTDGYVLEVVIARQNFPDSIVYMMKGWSGYPGNVDTEAIGRSVIYNIDSPAGPNFVGMFCSGCIGDSVTENYYCNGSTCTTSESCGGGSIWQQTLQSGLGLTNFTFGCQLGDPGDGNYENYQRGLVYYHKANGVMGGTFVQLFTGISTISMAAFEAGMSPNPAGFSSSLKVSEISSSPMHFKFFDAVGRLLMEKTVETNSTIIDFGNQVRGVYFWQLESNGSVLSRDRLVLQ
jgi:hypothetical protein